jgi:phage terminase Nu1 subunit (DNA packaging protein)
MDINRKTVNKAEFSREVGVSYSTVMNMTKKGIFDKCFTKDGKKLYLDCALKAYHGRNVLSYPRNITMKASETIEPVVYNTDSEDELAKLLLNVDDPYTRTRITNQFWDAKARRLKFLEAEGELIPLDEAKLAVSAVMVPFNKDLDDLPIQLKGHFPEVSQEAVDWLFHQLDEIKTKSSVMWDTLDDD